MLLLVLDKAAARAVHHAFGSTGGARRVHDKERVVERQLLEVQLRDLFVQGMRNNISTLQS